MTKDQVRELCQALRSEGVKRMRFYRGSEGIVPVFVEFFEGAPGLPTTQETEAAPGAVDTSGYERALVVARTGAAPEKGTR